MDYAIKDQNGEIKFKSKNKAMLQKLYPNEKVVDLGADYDTGWDGKFYAPGTVPPKPTTMLANELNGLVSKALNDFAHERQYDSLDRAMGMTGAFAADGERAREVYDVAWQKFFELEKEVLAGTLQPVAAMSLIRPLIHW